MLVEPWHWGGRLGITRSHRDDPTAWQSFTTGFVSNVNSFSWFEVQGKKLQFRQIDGTGREIDLFTLTK